MEARQLMTASYDNGYKAEVVKKWGRLLRGLKNESTRVNTALVLENEMLDIKRMMNESNTSVANVGEYTKFVFPLIRRTFPYLIANNICSVQPMTAPVGAIFYYDYTYGTTKGKVTAGDIFPQTSTFDYTYSLDSQSVTAETTTFVSPAPNGTNRDFIGTFAHYPVIMGSVTITGTVTLEAQDKTITVVDTAGDGTLTGAVTQGSTTCTASGVINYATGRCSVTYTVAPKNSTNLSVAYQYSGELSSSIGEVNLKITMKEVRAISRKLRSLMSVEAIDDIKAFHGIEAEADVIAGITSEMGLEIDNEIITEMNNNVPTANVLNWDRSRPAGIADADHLKSLIAVVNKCGALIKKASLRGSANWIVTSPEVAAILDSIQEFVADPAGQEDTYAFGTYKAGTLNNRYSVYVNVMHTADEMLIGYNGNLVYDTCYIHAPYLPMQITPTFLDPVDFQMKKGVRSRYANKLVRSGYLGKIKLQNL